MIFTANEIDNLKTWEFKVDDPSISTQLLTPLWDYILDKIPQNVAPNVLSLMGLVCILMSMMLQHYQFNSIFIAILIFLYQTLDGLDGKQARKIGNATSLGELIDHGIDSIVCLCLMSMVANLGQVNYDHIWCLVQMGQIVFLKEHLKALCDPRECMMVDRWTGPGEALWLIQVLFLADSAGMLNPLMPLLSYIWPLLPYILTLVIVRLGYYLDQMPRQFESTKLTIILSVILPGMYNLLYGQYSNLSQVIIPNLGLTLVTGDLILVKMAHRNMHVSIPIVMAMILYNSVIPSLGLILGCYGLVLWELKHSLEIPLLYTFRR